MPIEESIIRCVDQNDNIFDLVKVTSLSEVRTDEGVQCIPSVTEYFYNDDLLDARPDGFLEIFVDGEPVIVREIKTPIVSGQPVIEKDV